MKIRLQITAPDGAVRSLELRQPEVAIGRNPASPVAFADDAGKGVSWDHATIRVEGNKISIADVGSSNGTLLNDQMLTPQQPAFLKVKDRIQLGYTGPKIVLTAFDPGSVAPSKRPKPLAQPEPIAPSKDNRSRWLIGGGVAIVALLAIVIILLFGGKKDKPVADSGQPSANTNGDKKTDASSGDRKSDVSPNGVKPDLPPEPKVIPFAGHVVQFEKDFPGTLLQWPGASTWTPLKKDGLVEYNQMLVALPLFRCRVQTQSDVIVTAFSTLPIVDSALRGNSQGFYPLVADTSWLFQPPETGSGFDAVVVLDRGRLHFANGKPTGPARIKLLLRNSEWEVVLKDKDSQILGEYSYMPLVASKVGDSLQAKAEALFALYADGPVELKRIDKTNPSGNKSFSLADRQVLLEKGSTLVVEPRKIPSWPSWWNANFANVKDEGALDSILAIKGWAAALETSKDVFQTVLKKCKEEKVENCKPLAYYILASFGEVGVAGETAIEEICHVIESTTETDLTRLAALEAMRCWLFRSSKHIPQLLFVASVTKNFYTVPEVEQILRLAIDPDEADRVSPALYQGWLTALESPRPAIRFLAWVKLLNTLGEKVAVIPESYHPNKDPKDPEQVKAIAAWHKLVPPNWVPTK